MDTHTFSFDGLAIHHYKKYPGRPVIVFLHDSLGSTALWRDFPQQLANATQCNALIYDRLGYGLSAPMPAGDRPVSYMETEADTLHALLTHLEIDQVILFGHSDGGSIALITAGKYPLQIKAVICEAAHIFVEEITLKGIRDAMHAYLTTTLPQRLQKYHGDKTDTLFRAWTETWTRTDFRDWNIEHFLPEITCPLLFIQGEADEYGTLAQVERTVSQVSGKATQYIVPGIGHTPHKEAPALTLEAAKKFIETL
ncbi:alpha/beta hydrolase [Chitinophaga sp. G-6-1-13]|uniref:Alpha/beta hydrolase n=1 Tax=Chitinophaga fulva TaxID=2728842 RepID=A0A848GSS4_9BACT|nr:alpha/beta hydrolase [Chitinophaga fulva]NML41646.1 alpha/beta hydrolase [Chitinophaga fulva]